MVAPLDWDEDSLDWREYAHHVMCRHYENGAGVAHWLMELGRTTNGYRYSVYYRGSLILSTVIRPKCCEGYDRCPLNKGVLPYSPCREELRNAAMQGAYRHWSEFIDKFTGV